MAIASGMRRSTTWVPSPERLGSWLQIKGERPTLACDWLSVSASDDPTHRTCIRWAELRAMRHRWLVSTSSATKGDTNAMTNLCMHPLHFHTPTSAPTQHCVVSG